MSLLKQLAARGVAESQEVAVQHDIPMGDFVKEFNGAFGNRRTISDDDFAALKKHIAELRQQIMQGTFVRTTENLRIITAWFRASREESIVIIQPKKVKEKAPPKPRKVSKKKEIELMAQRSLEELL